MSQSPTPTSGEARLYASRPSAGLIVLLLMPLLGIVFALVTLATTPSSAPAQNSTAQNGAQTANPSAAIQAIAETPRPPAVLNQPAPNFTLQTLDGTTVSLIDYVNRPIFINFWATWCVPCIEELPALEAFAAEQTTQGENGAIVLALSVETPRDIQDFLTTNALELPNVRLLLDQDASIKEAYGVYMLPTTYIVSPDGKITNVKFGELTIEEMYSYMNALSAASTTG